MTDRGSSGIKLRREFIEFRIRRRDLGASLDVGTRERAVVDGEEARKPAERMQFDIAEQRAQVRRIAGAGLQHPLHVIADNRRPARVLDRRQRAGEGVESSFANLQLGRPRLSPALSIHASAESIILGAIFMKSPIGAMSRNN